MFLAARGGIPTDLGPLLDGAGGGRALLLDAGATELVDVDVVTNHAAADGGGVYAVNNELALQRGSFDANDGSYPGSLGGALSMSRGGAFATDTEWFDNFAHVGAALVVQGGASFTQSGGFFLGNAATHPGGASVAEVFDATFALVMVDLGAPAGPDNTVPEVVAGGAAFSYDGVVTLTCGPAGCAP